MLLPYEPEHLDLLRAGGCAVGADYALVLEKLRPMRLVYTVVAEGSPATMLAVVGAVPAAVGTVEVFILWTKARDAHPLPFARSVRHILRHVRNYYARIEAICAPDDARRRRFLEWMGFTTSGVLDGRMMRFSMEGA